MFMLNGLSQKVDAILDKGMAETTVWILCMFEVLNI